MSELRGRTAIVSVLYIIPVLAIHLSAGFSSLSSPALHVNGVASTCALVYYKVRSMSQSASWAEAKKIVSVGSNQRPLDVR